MKFVVLGLSITSSWGNGHATTYRALLRELSGLGHDVLFLERDVPWYAANRDLPQPQYCRTELYSSLADLRERFAADVVDADVVIVGSYVPEGVAVGEWVIRTTRGLATFYDIDTPVTLALLDSGGCEYISTQLIRRYALYLSFTGGRTLERLERQHGSPAARALYCSFDPALYQGGEDQAEWDLGYMGTYSDDRQPTLDRLLNDAARRWGGGRFVVAGPQYPADFRWPANVERLEHVPPAGHRRFYGRQRYTLNVTRAAMIEAGYAPSVRLFEAAACGTPIISDYWEGIDTLLRVGSELLIARSGRDVVEYLVDMPDLDRRAIGRRAQARVLSEHTATQRARELLLHVRSAMGVVTAA